MDHKEYKIYHESFMLNNNGTTAFETFLTIVPSFFTTFFYTTLLATSTIKINSIPFQFLLEFLMLVVPVIATVTILNEYIWELNATLLLICIPTIIFLLKGKLHVEPFIQIPTKPMQYLTVARSVVNLITCVCILAVDFQCFPRQLAKTETFGYGLMDTGVGLYVLINGVVSVEARKKTNDERMSYKKLQKILLSTSPLIALGLVRFFLVKEIDYQEHISEYGVHWNFFITLAAVRLFGSFLFEILPSPNYAHYACITVLCLHEMGLQLGLAQYVMSSVERNSFLSANREGIVSIPGYIGIYLISIYGGSIFHKHDEGRIRPKKMLRSVAKVLLLAGFCWKMVYVCEKMFGVSRRLANIGYCCWVVAIGATMILLFMLLEIFILFVKFDQKDDTYAYIDKKVSKKPEKKEIDRTKYTPLIHEAINFNALPVFLIANLLTGAVNLTFQTMLIKDAGSLVVITYYAFTLMLVMTFLYVNRIRMKFW